MPKKLEYLKNREKGAICVTSGVNKYVELNKLIALVPTVFISTALRKVSNKINDLNPRMKHMTQCISETVLVFWLFGARWRTWKKWA